LDITMADLPPSGEPLSQQLTAQAKTLAVARPPTRGLIG